MARAVIFFFNKESGPCTRVLGTLEHTRKKGAQRLVWRGNGFICVVGEKGGNTAPPHALETNVEACADAEREKRDERVLFSDWLIGVVCFFF